MKWEKQYLGLTSDQPVKGCVFSSFERKMLKKKRRKFPCFSPPLNPCKRFPTPNENTNLQITTLKLDRLDNLAWSQPALLYIKSRGKCDT